MIFSPKISGDSRGRWLLMAIAWETASEAFRRRLLVSVAAVFQAMTAAALSWQAEKLAAGEKAVADGRGFPP